MARMMTSGVSSSATIVEFSVTGVCRQDLAKTSNFTVRVPQSRMSQAMQNIHRMGGTISGISLQPSAASNDAAGDA